MGQQSSCFRKESRTKASFVFVNTCPSLPRIYVVAKRSLTTFPIQRNASEALVELSLSIGVEEIVAAES